jgi:UDP-N-acetyl-D-mannosaminuronic acid transferase (WecB/TagA/CpsF family)
LARRKNSADLEKTGVRLIAPSRPTAAFGPATELFIADHRQNRAQPLVVGDGALIDLADLVKNSPERYLRDPSEYR